MNFNKKKRNYLIPSISIFCVLYIFLSTRPCGSEIHFSPEWTKDVHHTSGTPKDAELIPYKLNKRIGYFTEDGNIFSSISYPFKSAISDKWYCIYSRNNSKADFYFADGTKAGTISESGFPFFDGDRIYLMQPGGTAFLKLDDKGEKQWGFENYSPITAFASTEKGTVAGYADGSIYAFDEKGSVTQKFNPGGSDIEVILGTGISEDGNRIACVSGQNRQRFIVAEKNAGHSRIIFHEYLENQINRQTMVRFSKNGDVVYYDYKGGLGIVNLKNSSTRKIPLDGKICQIEFSDDDELVFVLSKYNETFTVTVLERYFYQMAKFDFKGESSFIQTRGDSLFIGRDSKISRISISRK